MEIGVASMAKKRRSSGKRYKMTPRRRAALKKAQAASARKRRGSNLRKGLKTVGATAGFVGATFATYHMNRYIVRPDQAVRETRSASAAVGRAVKSAVRRGSPVALPSASSANAKWQKQKGGAYLFRG